MQNKSLEHKQNEKKTYRETITQEKINYKKDQGDNNEQTKEYLRNNKQEKFRVWFLVARHRKGRMESAYQMLHRTRAFSKEQNLLSLMARNSLISLMKVVLDK